MLFAWPVQSVIQKLPVPTERGTVF
jgi:hypothetical protein